MRGREVLPDRSRKKKPPSFHSSLVGNLPLQATSSGKWPGPRTEDKQLASSARSNDRCSSSPGRILGTGLPGAVTQIRSSSSNGSNPRRNTAPQPLRAHPSPGTMLPTLRRGAARRGDPPHHPTTGRKPNGAARRRQTGRRGAATLPARQQSQPAAHPLGAKISPGSSGNMDPRTVCAARRGISGKGREGKDEPFCAAQIQPRTSLPRWLVGKSRPHRHPDLTFCNSRA